MSDKKTKKLSEKERNLQEVIVWRDRIERGKKLRDANVKMAKKFIRYYKSKQWGEGTDGYQDKPVTNLIFAHVKSQLPFLYFQNPKWYVTPKSGFTEEKQQKQIVENAKSAQVYLNYYANENMRITLKKQMRLAILDAFFLFGAIKAGFVSDMVLNENYGKPKILGYEKDIPIYDRDDQGNPNLDQEENISVNEKFVARRISPASLIFDTECLNYFEDGRYIIEEISLPLQDVLNDPKYENTKELKPTYLAKKGLTLDDGEMGRDGKYKELQEDLKRVTLYEIYDIEHDKLKVLAEDHDEFLRNEETPAGIDGHPYAFLQYNDVPDETYPLSDIGVLKSPQDEYNKSRSLVVSHAKRFNRKWGYIEGMIEEAELTKCESGPDGTMFKVKGLPLGTVMEPMKETPLDSSIYTNLDQSRFDFDKLAATTEADRGVIERRKTAYEASKIYQSSDLRKEDRRSLVEDFASNVGQKLLQAMQANLPPDQAILIGGKKEAQSWETINRENISGEFTVKTDVGSMSPKLPEYERAEFMQFMQVLVQFPPELIQKKVNLDALLESLPSLFPALEDINLLNPPDVQKQIEQQQAQQKQIEYMLELAKMRGGKLHLDPNENQNQPKAKPAKQPRKK
jgi:hypothetical protein